MAAVGVIARDIEMIILARAMSKAGTFVKRIGAAVEVVGYRI
jgi:hypothetical protein